MATIALGSTGIYTINNITTPNNITRQGVYAAEGQKAAVVTARANIVNKGSYVAGYHVDALDISILLGEGEVRAGDFVEVKFNNINATQNIFENREIRINDEIVGRFKYVTSSRIGQGVPFEAQPLGSGASSFTYNLVFTENMEKYKNRNIEISSENLIGFQSKTTKDYELPQSVEINGSVVTSKNLQVKAVKPTEPYGSYSGFNRVWLSTRDGETIDSDGIVVGVAQQYRRPETRLQVGDIVEYNIPSDFGIAFNEELGRIIDLSDPLNSYSEFDKINPQGVIGNDQKKTKVKVIEASPHRVRAQITEIEGDAYDAITTIRAKILDTSSKTINYEESKLVEVKNTSRILRGDKEIWSGENRIFGDITGAKMKAYAQIRKRGSIIRQIQDEKGNKIPGFESDKLILERVQEGTAYDVPAPEIPGYTFARLASNSATQKGTVREGVQNVILVYKISAQNITIKIGDTPDPKSHIPDFDKNFPGCEVKYKETPDTSKSGTIDTTLIISCPDQPDREVFIQIIVEEEPKLEPPKTQESQPEAPNTGSRQADESPNILPVILAEISTLTLFSVIVIKRIKF